MKQIGDSAHTAIRTFNTEWLIYMYSIDKTGKTSAPIWGLYVYSGSAYVSYFPRLDSNMITYKANRMERVL